MLNLLKRFAGLSTPDGVRVTPEHWARIESRLPFLDYLDAGDRPRLRELTLAFLAEKEFHGANGLVVTDDIMLTIALQACVPILNIGLPAYRDWVGIIVYPGDILVPRSLLDEAGVMHEFVDSVLGEAWQHGPVLLAWQDEATEACGANVVIHEFAHKLDMANGEADGFPPLHPEMSRMRWSRVFSQAYEQLCDQIDAGEDTVLDPYAAEHPAEFFAVSSEVFFETPGVLEQAYPTVYQQLCAFYRLDPAAGERRLLAGSERSRGSGSTFTQPT